VIQQNNYVETTLNHASLCGDGAGSITADIAKNLPDKVAFREKIQILQNGFQDRIATGELESTLEDCTLKHYFSPIDEKYGCCTYAREMFIPKGTLIIGKIHRHQHLNFISKGKVSVATEFGKKYFEAPCTFISEVGLKRAVYAEENTIWTTVHMTKFNCETDLEKIEDEVIAPSYSDLGMLDHTTDTPKLIGEGEIL